jgi:nitroreductase
MDVALAIRQKRAIRTFAARSIHDEDARSILDAGRRAQSSKNTQPWHFVAVRDRATLTALTEAGPYAGHVARAAMAVVIATPDPAQRWSIPFDAGQAAAYMQLAAWELGIGSCLVAVYETEKVRALLGIPDDLHPYAALSFGYPDDPADLTRAPRAAGRRSAADVIHWERW